MPSAIESTALALTGATDKTDAQVIAEALKQMQHAIDDGIAATKSAFQAAIALGYHADLAKGAMPKDAWAPWMEKHFGEKSRRPLTIQTIYLNIRAARAFALLPKGAKKRDAILLEHGTVKKLAALLPTLENGDDPLELPAPVKAKRGAPTKAQRAAKTDAPAPDVEPANELAIRIRALDKREKQLDAKETRLNKLEETLNERERLLAIRESALPAGIADALPKDTADAGAASLEKARTAARKSAVPKPPLGAASVAKPKGKGVVAMKKKTPEIAPETADAIREAAQRAVGESGTDADPMAVRGGMNPDADAAADVM